jgi:hypothetical protein
MPVERVSQNAQIARLKTVVCLLVLWGWAAYGLVSSLVAGGQTLPAAFEGEAKVPLWMSFSSAVATWVYGIGFVIIAVFVSGLILDRDKRRREAELAMQHFEESLRSAGEAAAAASQAQPPEPQEPSPPSNSAES